MGEHIGSPLQNGNMHNKFNPAIHHRKSIRLKNYDYSQKGAYFVTICVNNMVCLFGEIVEDKMVLNDAGKMVQTMWNDLSKCFPEIQLDVCAIMPNHLHGIISIVGAPPVGAQLEDKRATTRVAPTLGNIVGQFKSISTTEYMRNVKQSHWPSFDSRLWQRNYYEHVIRNDDELNKIREYIIQNPDRWDVGADQRVCPRKG